MGNEIRIGEKVQLQVSMKEIQQLEYKDVESMLTLTSKDKRCSHETFDDCMYDIVAGVMKERTDGNCTVPWIRNNANICSTLRLGLSVNRHLRPYNAEPFFLRLKS